MSKSASFISFQVHGRAFMGVAVLSALVNVLHLSGSLFMLEIYDRVLPSRSVPTLIGLAAILVMLFCFQAAFDIVRGRILSRIGASLDESLGERVFQLVLLRPIRGRQDGDGQQPLRDLDQIRGFLAGGGPTALFDLPWMPLYLAICFAFHFWLGMTAVVGATLLVILTVLTEVFTRSTTREVVGGLQARSAVVTAGQRNAEVVYAMGMSGRLGQIWSKANRRILVQQQRSSDVSGGFGAVSRVTRMLLQSSVLAVGAYLVMAGEVTPGVMIASSILAARALAPVELAIANWKGFVGARRSRKRLGALLLEADGRDDPLPLPAPRKMLSVENVGGAAPGGTRILIENVNFVLRAGEGLGIIGPSGSGKSSVARTVVGVWPARMGKVRLDGAALEQWEPSRLGQHIGYLPQDVELFAGTIAQNIARFDPDADPEDGDRGGRGGGRARDDPPPAARLRDRDRRRRRVAVRRPAAAHRAGPGALRRSVRGGPGRAELQPRQRGRRGPDRGAAQGARAGGDRHRDRAPAERAGGAGPDPGDGQRQADALRAEGRGARRVPEGAGAEQGGDAEAGAIGRRVGRDVMNDERKTPAIHSIDRHLRFAAVAIALLVFGAGGWALTTELAGAVLASGTVVVEGNVKAVQHPLGGVVEEIAVRNGSDGAAGRRRAAPGRRRRARRSRALSTPRSMRSTFAARA